MPAFLARSAAVSEVVVSVVVASVVDYGVAEASVAAAAAEVTLMAPVVTFLAKTCMQTTPDLILATVGSAWTATEVMAAVLALVVAITRVAASSPNPANKSWFAM